MILFIVGLLINLINLYFRFAYIMKKFRYTCILPTKFSYTGCTSIDLWASYWVSWLGPTINMTCSSF